MNQRIKRLKVAGFRSIKDETLELSPVTVLIGPNGAGKSNFLWALEMLRMLAFESLQLFVSERGGATYLMHYGPRYTPAIDLLIEFQHDDGHENAYEARLGYGADESLLFLSEKAGYRKDPEHAWRWHSLGAGHRECMGFRRISLISSNTAPSWIRVAGRRSSRCRWRRTSTTIG